MIVPNLRVADMARAMAFYRDLLGLRLLFAVAADRSMLSETDGSDAVFATLDWNGARLMLQTAERLADELAGFALGADTAAAPGSPDAAIYFQGFDPDAVLQRVPPEAVVAGPVTQWYGMRELYLRDPDGHILCLGIADGPPPG